MDAEHINQIGTQLDPERPHPSYGGIFDYDAKAERLRTVNASLEDPTVWNDPKKAQELGREKEGARRRGRHAGPPQRRAGRQLRALRR
jgi:peptide chain release factor 2